MSNDAIMRSIKKASGELEAINYENIIYEGYGVGGSAVIVECLSDNRNRTAGEIRHAFDKFNGVLGTLGSVQFMFDRKGILVVEKSEKINPEEIMLLAIEEDAEDVKEDEEIIEIITSPEKAYETKLNLEKKGIEIASAEVEYIPQNYIELDEKQLETFNKMIEKLNESDDVQEVTHNVTNAD